MILCFSYLKDRLIEQFHTEGIYPEGNLGIVPLEAMPDMRDWAFAASEVVWIMLLLRFCNRDRLGRIF